MSICYQTPVQQISTPGDAGAKVDQDLTTLFRAVNNVIACQAKIADAFNDLTSGNFGSGGGTSLNPGGAGSGGAGSGGIGSAGLLSMPPMLVLDDQSTDYELEGNFTGLVIVNATDDIDLTFGAPVAGATVQILNVSATAKTVTVKNNGAVTIGVVTASAMSSFLGYPDSAGVAVWVAGAILLGSMGDLMIPGGIYVTTIGEGLNLRSPDGSYHKIAVSDLGALSSSGSAGPPT